MAPGDDRWYEIRDGPFGMRPGKSDGSVLPWSTNHRQSSVEKKRKFHRDPLTRRQLNDWAGADFRLFV